MKKILLIFAILLLAGYFVLAYSLGAIVKTGVNNFGPKLTQTKVELAEAKISPLTGSGTLSGIVIGNPKGWSDADMFKVGTMHLDVAPISVLGDHVVINELSIDGPECFYETNLASSNVKDLLKNIEQFTGSGAKTAETKSGQPIKFVVKKLRITNGKARVGAGTAAITVPLPAISLDDIGVKQGGITADQLAGILMRQVTADITVAATKSLLADPGSTIDKAKEAAKGLKDLFKKKP